MAVHDRSEKQVPDKFTYSQLIEECVSEVELNTQAPKLLVQSVALSAISTAVQGLADVQLPHGGKAPISLYILVRAKSGERKTTVFNKFFAPFFDDEKVERERFFRSKKDSEVELEIWTKKRQALLKAIGRMTSQGEDSKQLEKDLEELENSKPVKTKPVSFIYEDVTPEALMQGMQDGSKFAALLSSEGDSILRGGMFTTSQSKINSLWDGGTVRLDRKTYDPVYLEGGRLTALVMIQPMLHDKYLRRYGEESRGSGLSARFMVCEPVSIIGSRRTPDISEQGWAKTDQLAARLKQLLALSREVLSGSRPRYTIKLSPEACYLAKNYANWIESQMCPGGSFEGFEDHASKLIENTVRLAALINIFECSFKSDITQGAMQKAIHWGGDYSIHFKKVFYVPSENDLDDQEMIKWLNVKRNLGQRYLKKNYIRQNTHSRLRSKERLDACLLRLQQTGQIRLFLLENIQCVDLMPAIPSNYNVEYVAIKGRFVGSRLY